MNLQEYNKMLNSETVSIIKDKDGMYMYFGIMGQGFHTKSLIEAYENGGY